MSFKEKSTVVMLIVMLVVYGWYFTVVLGWASSEPVDEVVYQPILGVAVAFLVVMAVVGHIFVAVAGPRNIEGEDERDRQIERRGDAVGGYVLAVGAFGALWLTMIEGDYFWIAHAILAGMVLSEIVKAGVMLVGYRRGI